MRRFFTEPFKGKSFKRSSNNKDPETADSNPFRNSESSKQETASSASSAKQQEVDKFASKAASKDVPPPAYTSTAVPVPVQNPVQHHLFPKPVPRGASPSPSIISMASVTNDDDPYAFLGTFDTIFVVDDSGSMHGSNWQEVRGVLRQITPVCTARDKDGIDLYFLNHRSSNPGPTGTANGGFYNINDSERVSAIFEHVRPSGLTPTGARLHSILKPYIQQLKTKDADEVKPINIIIITDGRASDDPESVIVQWAAALDKLEAPLHQVGLQFFQVGSDPVARESLRQLDDDLGAQRVRDMVDTCTWDCNAGGAGNGALTADGILKAVLGAVVRKIDRKPTAGQSRRR